MLKKTVIGFDIESFDKCYCMRWQLITHQNESTPPSNLQCNVICAQHLLPSRSTVCRSSVSFELSRLTTSNVHKYVCVFVCNTNRFHVRVLVSVSCKQQIHWTWQEMVARSTVFSWMFHVFADFEHFRTNFGDFCCWSQKGICIGGGPPVTWQKQLFQNYHNLNVTGFEQNRVIIVSWKCTSNDGINTMCS